MSKIINCIIVDDEPLAIELLESHIKQVPQLVLKASCQHALQAFDILKKESIDLLFLDIQMPILTGIEFVKSMQHPPAIIFTTAYRQYAVESYELDVVDYLLKPITFIRFFKAINKFLDIRSKVVSESLPSTNRVETPDHLFVNANKKNIKVLFDDILFVESIKDYIRIHTQEKNIITKEKISEFIFKLPTYFLRVHRSFIVNTDKITAYTAQDIEIEEHEIPIGISFKKQVLRHLSS